MAVSLLVSAGLWWFLSGWVPTRGKTLLIETIQQYSPLRVSIGSLRYTLLRGAVLNSVALTNRDSGELVLSASEANIRTGWISWVLRKQITFSATLNLQVPCQTTLKVSGHYHTVSESFMADVYIPETDLHSVSGFLAKRIPAPLKGGNIEADVRFTRPSHEPLIARGKINVKQMVWQTPEATLTADFTLNGSATAPFPQLKPWTYDAQLTLRDGSIEGLAAVKTADTLRGKLKITDKKITVEELSAQALDSTWKAEGFIYLTPTPALDVLIRSQAKLQMLIQMFPEAAQTWQPEGTAALRAVCRGPLKPAPFLDCLAHADIQDATLKSPSLAEPVTQINGNINFDFLAKQIGLLFLEGHVKEGSAEAHGNIFLGAELYLELNVNGKTPLSLINAYLPPEFFARNCEGNAAFDLLVEGKPRQLTYRGRIDLSNAKAAIPAWSKTISELNGPVLLDAGQIQLTRLNFQIDKEPFALTATITPDRTTKAQGTLEFGKGQCLVNARITPDDILVDEAFLRMEHTTLRLQGRISKKTGRPSNLDLKGNLQLEELSTIPFFPAKFLELLNPQGAASVNFNAKGLLNDLAGANVGGTIRADSLNIRSIPLEQLTCNIEQESRRLTLRIPSALAAGGKWSGNLTIGYEKAEHPYRLETDIVALQLERLAQVVPAWRGHSVAGRASGHLILTGQWEKRSTWQGEGWLNAQGSQLGDVPLLEKLFQNGFLGPLASWLGLEPLRRAEITQASLRWNLANERIQSEDLRLVGTAANAAVVLYAKGSVGFDQTLDLSVEPQLSEQIISQAQATGGVASVLKAAGALDRFLQLVRYRITGTIKEPKSKFQFTPKEMLRHLGETSATGLLQNLFDQLTQ